MVATATGIATTRPLTNPRMPKGRSSKSEYTLSKPKSMNSAVKPARKERAREAPLAWKIRPMRRR